MAAGSAGSGEGAGDGMRGGERWYHVMRAKGASDGMRRKGRASAIISHHQQTSSATALHHNTAKSGGPHPHFPTTLSFILALHLMLDPVSLILLSSDV